MAAVSASRWLTVDEAADYLGLSKSGVRRLAGREGLKLVTRCGRRALRLIVAEVDSMVERCRMAPDEVAFEFPPRHKIIAQRGVD